MSNQKKPDGRKMLNIRQSVSIIPYTKKYQTFVSDLITGEARIDFLKQYLEGTHIYYNGDGRLTGFLIEKLGDGLILAIEPTAGLELLNFLVGRINNRIVIPETNMLAKEFLENYGYQYYMDAARMRLGERYIWKSQCVFSRGSGYCG